MKICPTCLRKFIDSQPDCPLDRTPLQRTTGDTPPGLGRELGNYRLICHLGDGGMGSIYIAAHGTLKRYVAIKVMKPELTARRDMVARFFEEARTVNSLKHPNIVESIDLVEDAIDGAYNVLELLHGPDLKKRMAEGGIRLDSALHIAAQIADALAAVHQRGIVHRDLKPENLILLSRGGRDDFVKLIDFGVAQVADEVASGKPFGTAAYSAPEQAAGQRVDGRADIYSLGVILFEMITGRHPFPSATDHEYVLRHADEKPVRASTIAHGLPRAVDDVIARCLEKTPQARFESATALAAALRAIDPNKRAKGGAGKWIIGGVLLAGAAAAGVIFIPQYLSTAPAAPRLQTSDLRPQTSGLRPQTQSPTPSPEPEARGPRPEASASPEAPEATPASVELAINSTPAGALVYREGETIPLGKTPFTATLLQSNKKTHLRFELDGYESHPTDVKVDESHEVTVKLAKRAADVAPAPAPAPVTPTPPPTPKKPSREGTLDPFAN